MVVFKVGMQCSMVLSIVQVQLQECPVNFLGGSFVLAYGQVSDTDHRMFTDQCYFMLTN